MKAIICISFLILLFSGSTKASDTVNLIFGILKGTVEVLQEKPLEDPTGCYTQFSSLHKAVNDLVDSIVNQASAVVIISNIINSITNLVYVQQYCVFHDMDDDIKHFTKHPGDLIGRLIWNYKLSVTFVRNFIEGLKTHDYDIIGKGLGALIYVVFDGKIL